MDPQPADDGDGSSAYAGMHTRWLYLLMGLVCVVLGIIGALLPVLPTTPFMLVALWAFSRSSRRFHDWLYHHRIFGPGLRNFSEHRVVPLRVKIIAAVTMSASFCWLAFFAHVHWALLLVTGLVMASVLCYLLSCPSRGAASDRL
jgi:uncharacterized membrane protein YbaN (DUF454 family)